MPFGKATKIFQRSTFPVQSDKTITCGFYCLFVLSKILEGYSFKKAISCLENKRLSNNENIVINFWKSLAVKCKNVNNICQSSMSKSKWCKLLNL